MTSTVDGRRRRLLLALVGVPALGGLLTACAGDPTPKSAPGSRPDADVKVRWRAVQGERALVALHAATVAAHPVLAEQLVQLGPHHDEHLSALTGDGSLPFGAGDASQLAAELPAVDVPADPAAALAAVRDAERAASQARLAECLEAAGPRLAAVLASIAASEAGHGTVLEGT